MKNTFGQSISVTIFGESHGEAIGAVIDGICPGVKIDNSFIEKQLAKRRPCGKTDTPRVERDKYQILSGVFNGVATGTPIAIVIPNENTKSHDYSKSFGIARPSHADYTANQKYHGYEDYRGGGHFSGRITASLVAVGGILIPMLEELGIKIGTHILKCGEVSDREFENVDEDLEKIKDMSFPTLNDVEEEMTTEILKARESLDSVGGILQTAIIGMPAGVGEPWFDSVEGMLSHAIFSIGGVKGIEFGRGFALAGMRGSEANDQLEIVKGRIVTKTNNNGGINGGITNGMPIVFNTAVKPTPSISRKQQSVNYIKGENAELEITGRHDPAIVRRICVVLDSVASIVIADMLAQRYGTDVFEKGIKQ